MCSFAEWGERGENKESETDREGDGGRKKIEELQMTLNEVMRNSTLLRENRCNSF